MSKYTFLYKENDRDDRDCVKYVDISRLNNLECDHYFPTIGTSGACFSMGLKVEDIDFDNVTTILTEDDFVALDEYNKKINTLGYGLKRGDAKYLLGIEYYNSIKSIIEKLLSEENDKLFEQVKQEEIEWMKEEYDFTDEDIETIFSEYYLDYRDRGIVGIVFGDIEEAAEEEADSMGYVTKENERYFDYNKFGEDLLQEERYLELEDGRIVSLNY